MISGLGLVGGVELAIQVPLAHVACVIASLFEHGSNGDFRGTEVHVPPLLDGGDHPATQGRATGEKTGSRGRTDGSRSVKIGEAHAFGSKAVEVRGAYNRVSVARQVSVSEIIGKNENDVGLLRGRRVGGMKHRQRCEHQGTEE